MLPDLTLVQEILPETTIVVAVLSTVELALEVVVTRRAILVTRCLATMVDDFLDPPFLASGCGVNGLIAVITGIGNTLSDVVTLGLQHVRQVELKCSLVPTHNEQIWIAMGMDAEQGADAGCIFVFQVLLTFADDLIVNTRFLDLKTRRIY